MNEALRKRWEQFLNGHWQMEMPQKEGRFPVATFQVSTCGYEVVYKGTDGKFHSARPWDSWWWSEAYPNMPNPPER